MDTPDGHTSDSFYFLDGDLVVHNKASFTYFDADLSTGRPSDLYSTRPGSVNTDSTTRPVASPESNTWDVPTDADAEEGGCAEKLAACQLQPPGESHDASGADSKADDATARAQDMC
eukprot:jgi/Ulvmu1/11845/UM081_0003.1